MVCPVIEENDRRELAAVEQHARVLREEVFPELRVECVHGRVSREERTASVISFRMFWPWR